MFTLFVNGKYVMCMGTFFLFLYVLVTRINALKHLGHSLSGPLSTMSSD